MKNKKVIYLSLDDLKELGIIKKKRKNKKINKRKYIGGYNNNIKSSSNHMISSATPFFNTSNLQTENIRLNNNLLENKLDENKNAIVERNNNNNQLTALQNDLKNQQNNYYYLNGRFEQGLNQNDIYEEGLNQKKNRFDEENIYHKSPFNSYNPNEIQFHSQNENFDATNDKIKEDDLNFADIYDNNLNNIPLEETPQKISVKEMINEIENRKIDNKNNNVKEC